MSMNDVDFGYLRPFEDADLETVLDWRNAPAVRDSSFSTQPVALADHKKWWDRAQQDPTQKNFIFTQNTKNMGVMRLTNISYTDRRAEWSFYTAPDAPKGTGKMLLYLGLEKAFSDLNLHKLSGEVLGTNPRSFGLHQSMGFKVEGKLVDHCLRDGKYTFVVLMAIFASEWAEIREEKKRLINKKQ